jgi:hypothetical protein
MQINGTRGVGGLGPVAGGTPSTQPAVGDSGKSITDSVTLSSEARARESAASHPRFGAFSQRAHVDPEFAKEMAYAYSHLDDGPLYDLSAFDNGGKGPMRYSATGEVVTPESEARYKKLAATHGAASLSLYNTEMAKGTDPADIFDKLIALVDAQPEDFRSFIDWEAKSMT